MGIKPEDVRYAWAYLLVLAIDAQLTRGTRHFRDRSGRLLQSLDEVVQAILSDNFKEECHDVRTEDFRRRLGG